MSNAVIRLSFVWVCFFSYTAHTFIRFLFNDKHRVRAVNLSLIVFHVDNYISMNNRNIIFEL